MGNTISSLWAALIASLGAITTTASAVNRIAQSADNIAQVAEVTSRHYLECTLAEQAKELRALTES